MSNTETIPHDPFSSNYMKHRNKFRGTTLKQGWEAKVIQSTRRWGNAQISFISYIILLKKVVGGGTVEEKIC